MATEKVSKDNCDLGGSEEKATGTTAVGETSDVVSLTSEDCQKETLVSEDLSKNDAMVDEGTTETVSNAFRAGMSCDEEPDERDLSIEIKKPTSKEGSSTPERIDQQKLESSKPETSEDRIDQKELGSLTTATTQNSGEKQAQGSSVSEISQASFDNKSDSGAEIDPYAYLKREEFTTEIYKIEINNLPNRVAYSQIKKKLMALDLKPSKVKLVGRADFAYVNFRSEEDRQQALTVLNKFKWKGRELQVKKANPAADPFLKRKQEAANSSKDAKRKRPNEEDESIPVRTRLNNTVTPLWECPYQEQLKKKYEAMQQYMKKLARQMEMNNRGERWKSSKIISLLQDIAPSPVINEYRNKCEFTIGPGFDGDIVVGFRLGSYVSGEVRVIEPTECVHVSQRTKLIVKAAQCYLQKHSEFGAYDPASKEGNWMQLTVRENRQDETMAIFYFNQQSLAQEVVVAEKQKLKEYFVEGEGQSAKISSLYFQLRTDRLADIDTPPEHLHGDQYIREMLFNLKFRISPNAFFQVNTEAAEVLYKTIGDFCELSQEKTLLLDICCGTGTIGLTLAKQVKRVVGIELCEEAVEDGKVNMKLNDIENADFQCGKAEDILPRILRKEVWNLGGAEIVAVVDPPRAGLHSDVIRAIRKYADIKQLVYVSCHPKSAMQNIIDLTRQPSNRIKGAPFLPVKVKPLDLFPHTDHCELVLLLER